VVLARGMSTLSSASYNQTSLARLTSPCQATLITTVGSVTNVALFVAILPGLGYVLTTRLGKPALLKDLWLLRMEGVVAAVGCLFIGLSPTRWALVGCRFSLFPLDRRFDK
jgi:hypothetical protein